MVTPGTEFKYPKDVYSDYLLFYADFWGWHSHVHFYSTPNYKPKFIINESKNSSNIPSLKEYLKENYKNIYDKYINTYYSGDKNET